MIMIRISQSISPQTWYNKAAGRSLPDVVADRSVMASTPPMMSHWLSHQFLAAWNTAHSLPLWKPAAAALRAWLAVRETSAPEVFVNATGEPMSRWGIAYILKQHVKTAQQQCPELHKKRISPHVLRHTCAMIVLQATQDIRKVSLWLGHSQLATTEIYTRGDPSEKLEAIEAIVPPHLRKGSFRPPDKLMAMLRGNG
jgi:hypothetical protein